MTKLFDNIDISGKRLEGEDFADYRKRRTLVNKITRGKLTEVVGKNTVKVHLSSQPKTLCYKKGYKETVPGRTEKEILDIFKKNKIKRVI